MRSCVSLLVLVGFLASQLAVFPHAQAAMTHDPDRPHVHLGGHSHEHSHADGHRHIHRHAKSKQSSPAKLLGAVDHDSDVVYLPPSGQLNRHEVRAAVDHLSQLSVVAGDAQDTLACVGDFMIPIAEASESLPDGRHLFLELGSLRI